MYHKSLYIGFNRTSLSSLNSLNLIKAFFLFSNRVLCRKAGGSYSSVFIPLDPTMHHWILFMSQKWLSRRHGIISKEKTSVIRLMIKRNIGLFSSILFKRLDGLFVALRETAETASRIFEDAIRSTRIEEAVKYFAGK